MYIRLHKFIPARTMHLILNYNLFSFLKLPDNNGDAEQATRLTIIKSFFGSYTTWPGVLSVNVTTKWQCCLKVSSALAFECRLRVPVKKEIAHNYN